MIMKRIMKRVIRFPAYLGVGRKWNEYSVKKLELPMSITSFSKKSGKGEWSKSIISLIMFNRHICISLTTTRLFC